MTLLIADIGGTNTRLALCRDGKPTRLRHFANDDFEGFEAVIKSYTSGIQVRVTACVIAIAGPVEGQSGRLTNRNWQIDAKALRQMLRCDYVKLLNDLTALGFALGRLPEHACARIHSPAANSGGNGQALVVGIGTGFNLCPVVSTSEGKPACLVVEAGHAALPRSVTDALPRQDAFATTEDLFSGMGLALLHAQRHPDAGLNGKQIADAHRAGTDPAASDTLLLFADLLGRLCTELALLYMPLGGIYFAGSVARGVLAPDLHRALLRDHASGRKLSGQLSRIPMSLVLDDAAALYGCIAAADA